MRPGPLTPADPRDFPDHMMSGSASGKEEGRGRYLECPPKTSFHETEPGSPGDGWVAEHPPATGRGEGFLVLLCLHMAFALPIQLYPNPWVFSPFQFSPHTTAGEQVSG